MKAVRIYILVTVLALLVTVAQVAAAPQLAAMFTYQGRLADGGNPAAGKYDFQFKLYDQEVSGSQVNGTVVRDDIIVTDGLFTVQLDFDSGVFDGSNLWLQIEVRPGASGSGYDLLKPRQPITGTPYAVYALNAGSVSGGISGSGTTNYIAKFTSSDTIGNSVIRESGGNVSIGTGTTWGKLTILNDYASTNKVEDIITIVRGSTGTVANGIGAAIRFQNEVDNAGYAISGRISSIMEEVAIANGTKAGMLFETRTTGGVMTDALYLDPDGKVGIGTTDPDEELVIGTPLGSGWAIPVVTVGGANGGAFQCGTPTYQLSMEHGSVFKRARIISSDDGGFAQGDIEFKCGSLGIGTGSPSSTAKLHVDADGKTYAAYFEGDAKIDGNLEIYNGATKVMELGSGLDYAEGFNVSDKAKITPGTVLVIDADKPGALAMSTRAYDRKVAGIVSGARGLSSGVRLGANQFDHDVALAGRVYCNVDATEHGVQPGDLLTTSARPGHAAKVIDYTRAQGAILGKAMESLKKGKTGQILVLVTLQ